jgi:ABC-type transporter Mla MlaB component
VTPGVNFSRRDQGVVFSTLFGRKKDKDSSDPATRPAAGPAPAKPETPRAAAPLGGQTTTPMNSPTAPRTMPPANAREIARATAEKIDKIESEMSLDFTSARPATSAPAPQRAPAPVPVAQAPIAPRNPPPPEPTRAGLRNRSRRNDTNSTTLPSLGQTTDILLGDSILANAMELADSASSPAIEEAAILYANGQPMPAIAVLSEAVKTDSSASGNTQAWLMLFELYQALGKKAEFENLAIDYAIRFESSAPAWSEDSSDVKPVSAPTPAAQSGPSRSVVNFKGPLSAAIVPQLDQLKRLAQKSPVLYLDFSPVTSVEASGCDLILRVFAAFQKSNHEVVIEGTEHLAEKLLAAVEVGRRDASNAIWMLLLETYRILGRQAAFEETSIDYCVTYEVSPPSWEPPSPRFRLGDEAPHVEEPVAAPAAEKNDGPSDAVSLVGDLVGKAEADLNRLNNFAAEHRKIVVDCRRLRRVDFTAAGVLLNWAVGAQAQGKAIEFRDVGNLVSALLVVMGLHEVAQLERRKF